MSQAIRRCGKCASHTKETRKRGCRRTTCRGDKCWQHAIIEDGLRVKQSTLPNVGMGLFAMRDFSSGSIICEYIGEYIDTKELERRYGNDVGQYAIVVANDSRENPIYIDARETNKGYGRFINHVSMSEANAEFVSYPKRSGEKYDRVMVEAVRTIKAGEEIFVDYGNEYWGRGDDYVHEITPHNRPLERSQPSPSPSSYSSSPETETEDTWVLENISDEEFERLRAIEKAENAIKNAEAAAEKAKKAQKAAEKALEKSEKADKPKAVETISKSSSKTPSKKAKDPKVPGAPKKNPRPHKTPKIPKPLNMPKTHSTSKTPKTSKTSNDTNNAPNAPTKAPKPSSTPKTPKTPKNANSKLSAYTPIKKSKLQSYVTAKEKQGKRLTIGQR